MHWMFRDQDPRMRLTPRAAAGPFWGRGGCSACCHAWHPCVGGAVSSERVAPSEVLSSELEVV